MRHGASRPDIIQVVWQTVGMHRPTTESDAICLLLDFQGKCRRKLSLKFFRFLCDAATVYVNPWKWISMCHVYAIIHRWFEQLDLCIQREHNSPILLMIGTRGPLLQKFKLAIFKNFCKGIIG